ncbi:MAG: helix-turn-helix domain-containing protein [Mangrovibacterium sp.]
MNDRIKQFMDYKGISSSELADSIDVQRSNITHVLQGRNKPGFLFISKLLETYPEVDAKWLITGQGDMLGATTSAPPPKNDLFSAAAAPIAEMNKSNEAPEITTTEPPKTEVINRMPLETQLKGGIISTTDKEIERIVVFYTDQTFKQYLPAK